MLAKALLRLLLLSLSGCAYNAHFDDCTINCSTSSGCPNGLTCGNQGLCRLAGASAACIPGDAATNDGTGGTITHVNGQTIHTFSAGATGSLFVPPISLSRIELLVVAGGGGGGATRGGGGGGAGGLAYEAAYVISQPSYTVVVGYGGSPAMNGENSSFGTITTMGGGAGRPSTTPNGGCGGGASHDTNDGPAGMGTASQGNAGGALGFNSGSSVFTGAGGGGAGGIGENGTISAGGAGGPGLSSTISGTLVYYAGGGGGGGEGSGLSPGSGGTGGGGAGGINAIGDNGIDGTGGGGGGGGNFLNGGQGGAGIVIISYPAM